MKFVSEGSQCQLARAVVRAATATKHEPGLSPSYLVESYGSAMEVWALLRRLSHYLENIMDLCFQKRTKWVLS